MPGRWSPRGWRPLKKNDQGEQIYIYVYRETIEAIMI